MAQDDKDTNTVPLELLGGSNLNAIKRTANKLWKDYTKLDGEKAAITDKMGAIREELKAMGIPKSAFAEVRRREAKDVEKRREHDFGVQVLSDAIGLQVDLFTPLEEKNDSNPKSQPKAASAKKPAAKKAKPKKPAEPDKPKSPIDRVVADAEETSAKRNSSLN